MLSSHVRNFERGDENRVLPCCVPGARGCETDMLEHRIRIDLELPAIMTEEVAFLWSLFKEWMHDAARRGGIEAEGPHQISIGQQLLDKLRIRQGVYRGADFTYVRTRYENQRSDDALGNTILIVYGENWAIKLIMFVIPFCSWWWPRGIVPIFKNSTELIYTPQM